MRRKNIIGNLFIVAVAVCSLAFIYIGLRKANTIDGQSGAAMTETHAREKTETETGAETETKTDTEAKTETDTETAGVDIRNWNFTVNRIAIGEGDSEAGEIGIHLTITNHAAQEAHLTLNSIYMDVKDVSGSLIERVKPDHYDGGDKARNSLEYFHYDVPSGDSRTIVLYYPIEKDGINVKDCQYLLHFNPFGTEGAVLRGKDGDGNVIEFEDTGNVGDININGLIEGEISE